MSQSIQTADGSIAAAEPVAPSKTEVLQFFDTAIQNPDAESFGSPVDKMKGVSIIRKKTLSTTVSLEGVTSPPTTYDVWFVQWDFEVPFDTSPALTTGLVPGTTNGRYLQRAFAGNTLNGVYNESFSGTPAWADPTFHIPVGSCIAYVMNPGESPFPTQVAGMVGPCQPLKVVPLAYDASAISEQSRMIGSNFEVMYTAPAIYAQGTWTQVGQASNNTGAVETLSTQNGSGIANFMPCVTTQLLCPGSTSSMVAMPGAVQRPAVEGVLQNARVDWSDNRPSLGLVTTRRYYAQEYAPGTDSDSALDLFAGTIGYNFQASGQPDVQQGFIYPNNCGIHLAVVQGLNGVAVSGGNGGPATLLFKRTATFEAFVSPNSQNIAFARPAPPADDAVMQRVENVLFATPQFWAYKDNKDGKFARLAKKVFNTTKDVVGAIAPNSKIDRFLATSGRVVDVVTGPQQSRPKQRQQGREVTLDLYPEVEQAPRSKKARRRAAKRAAAAAGGSSASDGMNLNNLERFGHGTISQGGRRRSS